MTMTPSRRPSAGTSKTTPNRTSSVWPDAGNHFPTVLYSGGSGTATASPVVTGAGAAEDERTERTERGEGSVGGTVVASSARHASKQPRSTIAAARLAAVAAANSGNSKRTLAAAAAAHSPAAVRPGGTVRARQLDDFLHDDAWSEDDALPGTPTAVTARSRSGPARPAPAPNTRHTLDPTVRQRVLISPATMLGSIQRATETRRPKQPDVFSPEPFDSATKKKLRSVLRGGLAEQLQKLVAQQRTDAAFRAHGRHAPGGFAGAAADSNGGRITLGVLDAAQSVGLHVVRCCSTRQTADPASASEHELYLILQPRGSLPQPGGTITVQPPWQLLRIVGGSRPVLFARTVVAAPLTMDQLPEAAPAPLVSCTADSAPSMLHMSCSGEFVSAVRPGLDDEVQKTLFPTAEDGSGAIAAVFTPAADAEVITSDADADTDTNAAHRSTPFGCLRPAQRGLTLAATVVAEVELAPLVPWSALPAADEATKHGGDRQMWVLRDREGQLCLLEQTRAAASTASAGDPSVLALRAGLEIRGSAARVVRRLTPLEHEIVREQMPSELPHSSQGPSLLLLRCEHLYAAAR